MWGTEKELWKDCTWVESFSSGPCAHPLAFILQQCNLGYCLTSVCLTYLPNVFKMPPAIVFMLKLGLWQYTNVHMVQVLAVFELYSLRHNCQKINEFGMSLVVEGTWCCGLIEWGNDQGLVYMVVSQ